MLRPLLFLVGCSGPQPSPSEPEAPPPEIAPPADVPEVESSPSVVEPPPPAPIPTSPTTLRDATREAGLPWPPPELRVHIDKSDRQLTVSSGDQPIKRYRVGLGGAPSGDKAREGDQRTPTGDFTIVTRNDRSKFHLFLGISYPNTEDAERGRRDGLVTDRQARAIEDAIASGRQPSWSTPLGGAIGIHGGGGGADWTLGCIAVENAEIEEIWEVGALGTPVSITE